MYINIVRYRSIYIISFAICIGVCKIDCVRYLDAHWSGSSPQLPVILIECG